MAIHTASAPKRAAGFYWVRFEGELIPGEYGEFFNEESEDKFFDLHPELDPRDPVLDYGWLLDFTVDEPPFFTDDQLQWIGEAILAPEGKMDSQGKKPSAL